MNWFKPSKAEVSTLVGSWRVDPADAASVDALGDVEMEFDKRGNLRYLIKAAETDQIVLMTYEVRGDRIITDQPMHPDPQESKFELTKGSLAIYFGEEASRFLRAEPALLAALQPL